MSDGPARARPLADSDLDRLQALLDRLPAPLEPLDVPAIDGYLCGVLLQPEPVPAERWLPPVGDVEGRPVPAGFPLAELQSLVLRRHAELARAIDLRAWFDPWVYPVDDPGPGHGVAPSLSVLPWVAGFATALALFPGLEAIDDPALNEPLALLYRHLDPDDLEDADALIALIETLEPPRDLDEAVEDLVQAVLLIADLSHPRKDRPLAGRRPPQRPRGRPKGR